MDDASSTSRYVRTTPDGCITTAGLSGVEVANAARCSPAGSIAVTTGELREVDDIAARIAALFGLDS